MYTFLLSEFIRLSKFELERKDFRSEIFLGAMPAYIEHDCWPMARGCSRHAVKPMVQSWTH